MTGVRYIHIDLTAKSFRPNTIVDHDRQFSQTAFARDTVDMFAGKL